MSSRRRAEAGYLLLIIALILLIGSLTLLFSYLKDGRRQAAEAQRTAHVLHIAQEALAGYATTFRERNLNDGFAYLPCPDLENDDGIANFIGTEAGNCGAKNATAIGLLPYNTLGLPELRDSEGYCLWYAVAATHKNHPRPDLLNWDTRSPLLVLDAAGNDLENDSGAAAIVFAPGAPLSLNGNEQSSERANIAKPCQTDSSHARAYLESLASPFTHGIKRDTAGNPLSNDRLAWVTSRELFANIMRRPDFAAYLNQHLAFLNQALLEKWPDATGNHALPDITLSAAELAALSAQDKALYLQWKNLHPADSSAESFYTQWRNQFLYYKCPIGNSACYTTQANTHCKGVLLWAGSGITNAAGWASNIATQQARGVTFVADEIGSAPGNPRAANRRQLRDYFEDALDFTLHNTQPFTPRPLYDAASPEQDLAFCLGASVEGFSAFRTVGNTPVIRVSAPTPPSGTTQLVLGDPSSAISGYGCAWHPEALLLSKGLRAYFRLKIRQHGAGFTFALADAANNPGTSMCGAGGSALGYGGENSSTLAIQSPKLALEFDMHRDSTRNDPSNTHTAFVFWAGGSRSANLDNRHGECAPEGLPCNPTSSPGLRNEGALDSSHTNEEIHVRVDIVPQAGASPPAYILAAYVTADTELATACALDNLQTDATCAALSAMQYTLQTAMSQSYMGFTTAQDAASGGQDIVIDNFKAQGR